MSINYNFLEEVIDYFKKTYPNPETELHYNSPFELLVAVILSAQCTDQRVNKVTPLLFKVFPNPKSMADASHSEIFEQIKSISYPNNKAKYLHAMSRQIMDKYHGEIPTNIDDLQKLPGVGRKTANVVGSVLFGLATMPVDTHVFRLSNRIGFADSKNVTDTETQLLQFIPKKYLHDFHHWLILHGRNICKARNPMCMQCGLPKYCKYFSQNHSNE